MQTGRWHEVDGPSSTQLRHTGRRAATTSTESRGVNGVGQRAAQASVEHGEYGRDKSRPARPARHQFRYKTLPTRAGRPLFRYKTRPTRAGRPLFRYKTRPARPKWPNLARFPLAGRVLSRFCRQQAEQGEFSHAPAPPHHGHERNNTPTTQFRMQFQLSRTPYQHGNSRIPTSRLQSMKHIRGNCMRHCNMPIPHHPPETTSGSAPEGPEDSTSSGRFNPIRRG